MKKHNGKKAIYVIRAQKGLLAKAVWRNALQAYPTSLICSIRERLQEMSLGMYVFSKNETKSSLS